MTDSEQIQEYMKSNSRFRNVHERAWDLLDESGEGIGYVWYKNILGGWRLKLYTEPESEWEKRGVIETVEQLKTIL